MSSRLRRLVAGSVAFGLIAAGLTAATTPAAAAVPPDFSDTVAIGGLTQPTAAVLAPDGRVLIAEKSGLIKIYDSLADPTATVFADLRPQVYDFWDRGLLGLAVDPQFPADPYVYALYTYDALQWNDACPNPPGATADGCLAYGRLSRLTMGAGGVATGEQVLITDWCQQYPSHSIGTVTFGPDGALYLGGGDGASFNSTDYGQVGNPCGDPPGPAGVNLAPPDARGGELRSQSPRRPAGEPTTLDGTIPRYDPDTGGRRIIAYGLRNQFRFGFRPNTNELWVGDVGWGTWEEINRILNATDATVENFGWPCFEGAGRQPGYDGANLTMCVSLYTNGGHVSPYYTYNHSAKVVPTDPCPTGGSAVAGIAFENGTSNYPAAIQPFVTGVATPVQTLIGPGGDLFYVALGAGQLRRVQYPGGPNRPPDAVATATPTSGVAPLTVQFDGSRSTDPDGASDTGLHWQVGQVVPFSGHATDGQDGTLPASALTWRLTLQHCTSPTNCRAHVVQNFVGVASGSFTAPDHEYPSYLDLTLTARDSDGNTASTTRRLDPRTVVLTFTSSPSGAQTHNITAPASATTYQASYKQSRG